MFITLLCLMLTSSDGLLVPALKSKDYNETQSFETYDLINGSLSQDYGYNISDVVDIPHRGDDREIYSEFMNLAPDSRNPIYLNNVSDDVAFVIFQVHTQYRSVSLYQESNTILDLSVDGTNIAIYSDSFTEPFFIVNIHDIEIQAFVSVHGYGEDDPIPGGCSLEYTVPIVPFMKIDYFDYYVQVAAPPPRSPLDPNCLDGGVHLSFYLMYLPGRRHDAKEYFDSIRQMMTLKGIREKGTYIPETLWRVRRKISRYQGTSRVYVAVARTRKGYSVYAPIFEDGCKDARDNLCYFGDIVYIFMHVVTLIVGYFLCYFGRQCFYFSFFIMTFYMGYCAMYTLITAFHYHNDPLVYTISIIFGCLMGIYWKRTWFVGRTSTFSLFMSITCLGCIIGAALYYRYGDDVPYLRSNLNFWCVYVLVVLLADMILFWMPDICLFCTPWVGAFLIVYSMSHFKSANTKFIVINLVRRATMFEFNEVLLMRRYEFIEKVMVGLLFGYALTGLMTQISWRCYKKREPIFWFSHITNFRSSRTPIRRDDQDQQPVTAAAECDERTPLLS